jgi:glycosyltransferase involved in cell wall biosynthesis
MRIAYVVPRYLPDVGGVETHVAQIASRVADAGHEVEVITQTVRRDLAGVERIGAVRVRRFSLPPATRGADIAPALCRYLTQHGARYDLIHGHNYHSPPALAAALLRRPIVFTPHYHGRGHVPIRRWLHIPYRVPGALVFHRSRRVICVSEAERDLVVRHFPFMRNRSTVIPNGVDLAPLLAAHPYPADGRIHLVSVGRLANYKRMDLAIDAMRYLDDRFVLSIIGQGPMAETLQRQIAREGLTERVRVLQEVDDAELARRLRSAPGFILLSEHESFSITPREALAAGAQAIISDIPVHREIARDAGHERVTLVPLHTSPEEVAGIVRAAALRPRPATPYLPPSWDDVADRTLALYREVLHEPSV